MVHIKRIKKPWLNKVRIKFVYKVLNGNKLASAFIVDTKPPQIFIQIPHIREAGIEYLTMFFEDNIVDLLRHEFAHLKVKEEGEKHQDWQKKIDLFKKK